MQLIEKPKKETWIELIKRPEADIKDVEVAVHAIVTDIKRNGTVALKKYNSILDGYQGENVMLDEKSFQEADGLLDSKLKNAIEHAARNIEKFHSANRFKNEKVETQKGVVCWKKQMPIENVGLYIPGGTAPLFSTVLMLGIPAQIAGSKNVFICTPPNASGKINPAIIYAAKIAGITKIYLSGGAQAIAAMAFGNAGIPKADKIFGPGNRFVTAAKNLVSASGVAIDMPAGPSEVLVIADEHANPRFVASDLLSQAEHGTDSQVICLCISTEKAEAIQTETITLLNKLPRKEIATKALENSRIIILNNLDETIEFSNQYAPEHLILACADAENLAEKITQAGSVFLGNFSPESAGDYASGTNHTLPTNGFAKAYSGVSVDSFMKNITFQQLTKEGLNGLAETVITMAEAEGLDAHALAIKVRIEN